MWLQVLKRLFLDTIYAPRTAARQLLGLDLPGNEIWMALVLATVLNAIAYICTLMAFPQLAPPILLSLSPLMLTGMFFVSMAAGTAALFWGGKTVGGVARFNDLLLLITWLQFIRLAIQIGTFALMLFLPGLAGILNLLATLYVVWILLSFVNEAQGFDSIGKSIANLLLGFLGLVIVLSFLISVVGLGTYEIR